MNHAWKLPQSRSSPYCQGVRLHKGLTAGVVAIDSTRERQSQLVCYSYPVIVHYNVMHQYWQYADVFAMRPIALYYGLPGEDNETKE